MAARPKISVIGAGNVGASVAQYAVERELGDVVLVDVIEGIPQGKALDLAQAGPVHGYDSSLVGSNGYDEAAGAEVFVVTAGIARKPGMSRDDLVKTNAGIVRSVSEQIARVAPKAIVVVVSNPLDVMCYVAMKTTRFPRERIIGMAGVLDTARYRTFLAEAVNVSVTDIQAMVLGGHGDTMVPLVSYTTVSGIPVHRARPLATYHRGSVSVDLVRALARAVRAADVIHLHAPFHFGLEIGAAASLVTGVPLVVTHHGEDATGAGLYPCSPAPTFAGRA